MPEATLRDWINDDDTLNQALAVFKVGCDKGQEPREAFRIAVASVFVTWFPDGTPPPFRGHDERIARVNRIFREFVVPLLPEDEVAVMMVKPSMPGILTYISNGERGDCAKMLRELLGKWDADAADKARHAL